MRGTEIEEIIEEYGDMLYRLALVHTRNEEDASDMVQQTFLKFLENHSRLKSREHTKAWLIRVCINHCINLSKSAHKRLSAALPESPSPASFTSSVQDEIQMKFQNQDLWEAVFALPEKYRSVLHLNYMDGYSPREIARILHISYNSVCTRLNRAKKMLAASLKKEDYDYD